MDNAGTNGLVGITNSERFHFENLAELRDWLNQFSETDLSTVLPRGADHFMLTWFDVAMSDGSTVNDARITTL